jgi:hypothetical protein
MTKIPIVLTFALLAVVLGAQTPPPSASQPTPLQELATIVAVEEQERDLAKAEQLYRQALTDQALSPAARDLALERLLDLLFRLGRRDDAKQVVAQAAKARGRQAEVALDDVTAAAQQPNQAQQERQAALRQQAEAIVSSLVTANPVRPWDQAAAGELEWIGVAAVPVIAAALAAATPALENNPQTPHPVLNVLNGAQIVVRENYVALACMLWQLGGEDAIAHLESLRQSLEPKRRQLLARGAHRAKDPRLLRLAEQWLVAEVDAEVRLELVFYPHQIRVSLFERLDPDVVLDTALRERGEFGSRVLQGYVVLHVLRGAPLVKLLRLVGLALDGSDPRLAVEAQRGLAMNSTCYVAEGVDLLLEHLPRLPQSLATSLPKGVYPEAWQQLRGKGDPVRLRPELAATLWPRLLATARRCSKTGAAHGWIATAMSACPPDLPGAAADLLALANDGYVDYPYLHLLHGRVQANDVPALLQTFERDEARKLEADLLGLMHSLELPSAAFAVLLRRAELVAAGDPTSPTLWQFAMPMARTGDPAAAAWLTAQQQRTPDPDSRAVDQSFLPALLELGRRSKDEAVRQLMRTWVGSSQHTSRLQLALLSMADEPTLALVLEHFKSSAVAKHPYAVGPYEPWVSPLDYLLAARPQPPHGYTVGQQRAVVRELAGKANGLSMRTCADGVLSEVVQSWSGPAATTTVVNGAVDEIVRRWLAASGDDAALRWREVAGMLSHAVAAVRQRCLQQLGAVVDLPAPALALVERSLADQDEAVALAATEALLRHEPKVQRLHDRLLGHRLAAVRERAWRSQGIDTVPDATLLGLLDDSSVTMRVAAVQHLAGRLSIAAVPDLVRLLRDPADPVRVTAADALTKIRFYQEQQAHWDRVLQGLDASPASAAEKLLLQARPEAPKAQRLLAITSLGVLGAPEALPFLIDWSQQGDADIATAARDAIGKIHLQPRR